MSTPFAVIDIGTNAVKCAIYNNGRITVLNNKFLNNSQGYDDLNKDEVLTHVQAFINETKTTYGVDKEKTHICATEGLRTSKNQQEICDTIYQATGRPVLILYKQTEARLSFYGAMLRIPQENRPKEKNILYIESGGGSTEMTLFSMDKRPPKIVATVSVPFGSKRFDMSKKDNVFESAVHEFTEQINNKNFHINVSSLSCLINSTTAARIIASTLPQKPVFFNNEVTMEKQRYTSAIKFHQQLDDILNNKTDFNYWLKNDKDVEGFKNHCRIFKEFFYRLSKKNFPINKIWRLSTSYGGVKEGYLAEQLSPQEISEITFKKNYTPR